MVRITHWRKTSKNALDWNRLETENILRIRILEKILTHKKPENITFLIAAKPCSEDDFTWFAFVSLVCSDQFWSIRCVSNTWLSKL